MSFSILLHLPFWASLSLNLELTNTAKLVGHLFPHPFTSVTIIRMAGMHHYTWLFSWVLGIQAQVFMLVQEAVTD